MQMYLYRGFAVLALAAAGTTTASADTLHVPGDHATIQAAIDAAEMNDSVLVAAGTYREAIDFSGKTITVESADGPEATVIDATGLSSSVVAVTSGEDKGTTLRGFTITGGTGSPTDPRSATGAPFAFESTQLTCSDLDRGKDPSRGLDPLWGGGIFVHQASLLVDDCIISDNHLEDDDDGGGIAVFEAHDVRVQNSIIDGNSARLGGGVVIVTSAMDIVDCAISNNTGLQGGGLNVNLNGSCTVSGTTFQANLAHGYNPVGGGAFVFCNSPASFEHCDFIDNTAEDLGGGMWSDGVTQITHCNFIGNTAQVGGGLDAYGGEATVQSSVFKSNDAEYFGGGISIVHDTIEIDDCLFLENTSIQGGGLFIETSDPAMITQSSFEGNTAEISGGGVAVMHTASDLLLQDCSITNNQSPGVGGLVIGGDAAPKLGNVIVCGNTVENFAGDYVDLGGNEINEHCSLGDLDNDGIVNVSDMLILLAAWGECPAQGDCPADLDDSGEVNVSDLLILLSNWG